MINDYKTKPASKKTQKPAMQVVRKGGQNAIRKY